MFRDTVRVDTAVYTRMSVAVLCALLCVATMRAIVR